MIGIFDVQYGEATACAACVLARDWVSVEPSRELARLLTVDEPYVPGRFFLRELPPLLALIEELETPLKAIVVDGYVTLGEGRPGLGGHLHERLREAIPVVGVAKNEFVGAPAVQVRRGGSRRPLFVTAAGLDPSEAADCVRVMHGEFRIPTLLKRADKLARGLERVG